MQYVLKPQREGGGNNIWGDDVRKTLVALDNHPSRAQYILMRRITPTVLENRLIQRGSITPVIETISEVSYLIVIKYLITVEVSPK